MYCFACSFAADAAVDVVVADVVVGSAFVAGFDAVVDCVACSYSDCCYLHYDGAFDFDELIVDLMMSECC